MIVPSSILRSRCHRIFSREVEKKEIVGDDVREGELFTGTRGRPFPVEGRKAVVKYSYYYKCLHCQHE